MPTPPADPHQQSGETLSRYWTDDEEEVMQRTARNYDLILAYTRDSEGGQRWSTEDIAAIRFLGRHLHQDRRALNRLRHALDAAGGTDGAVLIKMRHDKDLILKYCERIDVLIRWLEKRPRHHLLNSGEFEEFDGNIFRVVKGDNKSRQTETANQMSSKAPQHIEHYEKDPIQGLKAGKARRPASATDEEIARLQPAGLASTFSSHNLPDRNARDRELCEDDHQGVERANTSPFQSNDRRRAQNFALVSPSLPRTPRRRRRHLEARERNGG